MSASGNKSSNTIKMIFSIFAVKITNFTNISLGFGLGLISAFSQSSYAAGETYGNPLNDCNPYGECATTPSKISVIIKKIGICKNNPMTSSQTLFDWSNGECEIVYDDGEDSETGNLLDSSRFLENSKITIPSKGYYNYSAVLISNNIKLAGHHVVIDNSTNLPIDGTTYITSSSALATTGNPNNAQLFTAKMESFYYGFDCGISGHNQANSKRASGYWGNQLDLRLLTSDLNLANVSAVDTSGLGKSSPNQRICADSKYILGINKKTIIINEDTKGLEVRIRAPKGSLYLSHNATNATVTTPPSDSKVDRFFSGNSFSISVDVQPLP